MRAHAITRAYHRSPTIRMMVNLHQLMENLHQPNRNVLYRLGKADIGRNRKLKQITSQKTCREKEHFEILNIARGGIEAGNDLLIKFLAFLFRVWVTFIDIENISLPVIFKGTSKNSPYNLFLSFPRKRESIKIKHMDSPIKPGNDKKMNN